MLASLPLAAQQNEPELTDAQIDSLQNAAYGNVTNLEELVVAAKSPMIKVSNQSITYDVEEDPSSAGQTVLDMLRKVPLVAVDGNDNITVKGSGGVKIYVNGKPEPMLTNNAAMILKAMPAESVAKIELITDPGAKYDAEGGGSIINLVTERRQKTTGYNGNLTASVSNQYANAGGRISSKFNDFTVQAGVNYMKSFPGTMNGETQEDTWYLNDADNHHLTHFSKSPRENNFFMADLGMSWDISTDDLLTVSANFMNAGGKVGTTDGITQMYNQQGDLQWQYTMDNDIDLEILSTTANVAYQHLFSRPDNFISASYQFNFGTTRLPISRTYGECINYYPDRLHEYSTNNNYTREHTLQIDYSNTLSPHARIEVGGKGIFRRNAADSDTKGSSDLILDAPIPELSIDIRQPQDIYALYALYTATYGSVSATAGARYEHTRMGIDDRIDPARNLMRHLNDIVPEASIAYNFSPMHSIAAKYYMKISRPSIQQLNPFMLSLNNVSVQKGNPDLTSERINKVSLSYTNFGRAIGGTLSLDFTHSGNAISQFSYLDGYQVVTTYANIGRNQSAALNAFLMWNATAKLRFTLNGTAAWKSLRADASHIDGREVSLSNSGWTGSATFSADWTLPARFQISGYAGWNGKDVTLQGSSADFHYYGLSIARSFLRNDALKLTLSGRNMFERWMTFTNSTSTPDVMTRSTYRHPAFNISLTATWNFGHTGIRVKGVNRGITNDDVSRTSNGAAGGATGAAGGAGI